MAEKVDCLDDFYKLLHPRPVFLIAAIDDKGKPNIMSCAWATPVSEEPKLICIALWKKGYTNELIRKTKEFTINVTTEDLIKVVKLAGSKSGRVYDKIKLTKVRLEKSKLLKTPMIKDCVANLGCKLVNYYECGECWILIGEVVEAKVDKQFFKKVFNVERAKILLHLGDEYFTIPEKLIEA
ncbi:MAG: flavin reductase family protein [Candidatus Thermoplasmatota archaeon]